MRTTTRILRLANALLRCDRPVVERLSAFSSVTLQRPACVSFLDNVRKPKTSPAHLIDSKTVPAPRHQPTIMNPNQCSSKARTWNLPQIHPLATRAMAGLIAAVLLPGFMAAKAEILGPYTPDDFTLHLWHMDEPAVPVVDAVTNGLDLTALDNNATLGNESYLGPKGFGTALCTYTGNPNVQPGSAGQDAYLSALPLQNGAGDNVALNYAGPSGAFTYEAIVRIDFDPAVSYSPGGWGQGRSLFMQIICADADEAASRVFQFRLVPVEALNGNTQPLLEFINLNKNTEIQNLTASIPTEGPDAILLGNWYHVAVTYNGQPGDADNLHFYWTLVSPDRTAAHLIGTGQMNHSLPAGCRPDFAIGQTGRQSPATPAPNNNFVGLIDEVRISGVERPANGMLFGNRNIIVAKSTTPAATPSAVVSQPPPALIEKHPATPSPEPALVARTEKPAITTSQTAVPQKVSIASSTATPASAAFPAHVSTGKDLGGSPIIEEGVIVRGPIGQRRLAILFSCRDLDEGAPVIMECLKAHHAKASFFVSSGFLKWPLNSAFVQTASAEGHYVGPQSDSWTQFASVGSSPGTQDVLTRYPDVEAHLKRMAGLGIEKTGRFFLPTADQANSEVANRGRNLGLIMVGGTPGTLSFATATVEGTKEFASSQEILNSILGCEHRDVNGLNGFLMLFPLDSGPKRKDRFYAHFDQLLSELQNRGYEFVRVDELLDSGSAETPKMLSLGTVR